VIANFKTYLSTIPQEIQSDPELNICVSLFIEVIEDYVVKIENQALTYETQPKNIVFFDEKVEILIKEQHSWTN